MAKVQSFSSQRSEKGRLQPKVRIREFADWQAAILNAVGRVRPKPEVRKIDMDRIYKRRAEKFYLKQ